MESEVLGLEVSPAICVWTSSPGILMQASSWEPLLWSNQAFSFFNLCKHFFKFSGDSTTGCYQGVSILDTIIYVKEKGRVKPGEFCELGSLHSVWLLNLPLFPGLGVMHTVICDVLEYNEWGRTNRVVSMSTFEKWKQSKLLCFRLFGTA